MLEDGGVDEKTIGTMWIDGRFDVVGKATGNCRQ